ncbi:MAG: hypothetical protein WDA00_04635 [Eubacteriales bacterium]
MPYCVKCGVELAESEDKCPLCHTVVYHPDLPLMTANSPYPAQKASQTESVNRYGVLFFLSVLFVSIIALTLLIDVRFSGRMTWSGYPIGAVGLLYVITMPPLWFKRRHPIFFVALDYVAVAIYLWLVAFLTGGGWMRPFALPLLACLAGLTLIVMAVSRYLKCDPIYLYSGVVIAIGLFTVLLEGLINRTFQIRETLVWSLYPLASCLLVGVALVVVALCKPLREALHKIFFV